MDGLAKSGIILFSSAMMLSRQEAPNQNLEFGPRGCILMLPDSLTVGEHDQATVGVQNLFLLSICINSLAVQERNVYLASND